MLGKTIAGAAIGAADRRELASEFGGPWPGGVRAGEVAAAPAERRQSAVAREANQARASKP